MTLTFEQIIGTQQAQQLDNLAGELFSLEAESYADEVRFGWQEKSLYSCKHCEKDMWAYDYENKQFCSIECEDEYMNVPTEFYEIVEPFPSHMDYVLAFRLGLRK